MGREHYWMTTKIAKPKTERERDRLRKRDSRKQAQEVQVRRCKNQRERKRLESSDECWLQFFFRDLFWYEFTIQQREMIAAIRTALKFGGDQAIAASRGEGKTKIVERLILKNILTGAVGFAVLFAATGPMAGDSLESIKTEIEENNLLGDYYPEVCDPVRALEDAPQRARGQLVTGYYHNNPRKSYSRAHSRFRWCGQEIVFPNVPGSPSARAVIATRGLDSAVRGLNKLKRRVDLACIDDPDTEETVNSEEQAVKLEKRIDMAIAGLGGQQRGIARVMLTTIQNRRCVSFRFTDPQQKPSWQGRRFRFLVTRPDRIDMWEEYLSLRQADQSAGDRYARRAHQFYVDNRDDMDKNAVVANPNRFDTRTLPDGSQAEISALQRYFNEVARIGQEAVSCEYDNDPPEESGPRESGITATRVQKQVSGYPRKQIPFGCTVLTQGIDVGKQRLHWIVRAWRPEECGVATGFTIDYGTTETHGTTPGSDEGVDEAITRALFERRDEVLSEPYRDEEGRSLEIGCTLVDSLWKKEAVLLFCDSAGLGYYPGIGYGKSAGCAQVNFHEPVRSSPDKVIGWQYFIAPRMAGWMVHINADHWKGWEHDRWMMDTDKPGCLFNWGEPSADPDRFSIDEKFHFSFARHLTAEVEVEEPVKGVLKRYWKAHRDSNHWFDAAYRADVAAAIQGVRLFGMPADAPIDYADQAPRLRMPDGRPYLVTER